MHLSNMLSWKLFFSASDNFLYENLISFGNGLTGATSQYLNNNYTSTSGTYWHLRLNRHPKSARFLSLSISFPLLRTPHNIDQPRANFGDPRSRVCKYTYIHTFRWRGKCWVERRARVHGWLGPVMPGNIFLQRGSLARAIWPNIYIEVASSPSPYIRVYTLQRKLPYTRVYSTTFASIYRARIFHLPRSSLITFFSRQFFLSPRELSSTFMPRRYSFALMCTGCLPLSLSLSRSTRLFSIPIYTARVPLVARLGRALFSFFSSFVVHPPMILFYDVALARSRASLHARDRSFDSFSLVPSSPLFVSFPLCAAAPSCFSFSSQSSGYVYFIYKRACRVFPVCPARFCIVWHSNNKLIKEYGFNYRIVSFSKYSKLWKKNYNKRNE